jgi:UDP-N-acetylmuramyl tripeptide synthase
LDRLLTNQFIVSKLGLIMSELNLSILVDYAHEPESMRRLLETTSDWKKRGLFDAVIHVVSCCGKGRDDWKKPVLGSISYLHADFSVVTTEEYTAQDDPNEILNLLTEHYPEETKCHDLQDLNPSHKYMKVFDRREALAICPQIAKEIMQLHPKKTKFLLVSTSMGSQQTMTLPEGEIDYDEREEWRKVFNKFEAKKE